ncbi:MAG: 50S ribosomal protein L25 [Saprospiraceae bacterium]|nr:50S ribosomal protein L25 [Saprospiraceae bacterium]
MEVMTLNASPRTALGKVSTKAIRKANRIPCVLYGGNELQHFTLAPLDLRSLVYSPEFKVVEINVDGNIHKCILKSVQYHPVTESIMHIDFLRLIDNHPIKIEVPISFEGIANGLKSGGKLIKKMRKVKIKTLPEHLVDKITLDITPMELGQSQRIKDLVLTEGIEVLNNENIPIATIDIPRALRGAAADDAATPGATPAAKAAAPAAKAAAPAAKAAAPAKAAPPAKKK